jgi:protein TonB
MEKKKSDAADLEKWRGLFFQTGLVVSLALVWLAFEWNFTPSVDREYYATNEPESDIEIIPLIKPEVILPPPPPPPKVIPNIEVIKNTIEPVHEIDASLLEQDVENTTDQNVNPLTYTNGEVFSVVEEMPDFQGKGVNGFRKWIAANLKYPPVVAEKGIQGTVWIEFVVASDGKVRDINLKRGVHELLDKEALRVISASPDWIPGKRKGKTVAVIFTVPINFVSSAK